MLIDDNRCTYHIKKFNIGFAATYKITREKLHKKLTCRWVTRDLTEY